MTADNNNNSGSDNSGSRDRQSIRTARENVIALLQNNNGWSTKLRIRLELNYSEVFIDEVLDSLRWSGDVHVHDLGDSQLVTTMPTDPREAYAEFSDTMEDNWRQLTNDQMPNIDER